MAKNYLKVLLLRYKECFSSSSYITTFASGIILFLASYSAFFYSSIYATEKASNYVTDIVLSNTRVFDVDAAVVYGPVILWIFVLILLLNDPKKIPFTIKSVSLFILIRSMFVSLTHLGPFPTHIDIGSLNFLTALMSGGDYFFSGHTGLPYLLTLLFWDNLFLRVVFFTSSIFFGTVVLLGHLHYSIDVLAAFFITYSIYHLAEIFFPKDKKIFKEGFI
jgi:hypothetical protein